MGKKREKNAEAQQHQHRQNPNVAEASRIRISQILDHFRAGNDQVYTFEDNLSNCERAVVHEVCRKMGMTSKSSGCGNQRRVSVYKETREVKTLKKKESRTYFTFSEESKLVLQDLFANYPPEDGELQVIREDSGKHEKILKNKDDIFCKPSLRKKDIVEKVESYNSRIKEDANLRKVVEDRCMLPIACFKDVITSTIESHKVVLISGETGCGKTTQVPQFLLDHMWEKGEVCKIVCTQPRRISATSVAERVSCERGQNIGDDVGYKIRLESKGGRNSSIVFCTNGVLLRVLVSKGMGGLERKASKRATKDDLCDITHIIVDEIHERDRYSDFMLAIIRDMLPLYPHIRLILMSATLDAERFSKYFGGCPIIRVPGFTYTVRTFFLEDVLSIIKSEDDNHLDSAMPSCHDLIGEEKVALDEAINLAWSNDEFDPLLDFVCSKEDPLVYNYQHSLCGLTPLMVFAGKGKIGDVCRLLSVGVDCHIKNRDGLSALELAKRENQQQTVEVIKKHLESVIPDAIEQQQLLDKYLATINPDFIDVVLIEQLLKKICLNSKDGAILLFLPGWDDINKTRDRLVANPFFRDTSKFLIISLHSMVPSAEQRKVFKRPPQGCRKIVLSTNIAESSITIDDVVYVIDSGRMKEKSYDPYNNVSTLQSSWVSKASAKQREGRAGRCQPGICYHLYSKLRAASLPNFQVPEIKRMPIEELCLQVKLLDPNCKIDDFLMKTLDPPVTETIHNAITILQDIGALSLDEHLTALGEKLGCLPVHPLTSKMLFFAILMNCLDPALTLACASEYRDPFTLPVLPTEKKRANAARFELASLYGGHSDQLAVIAAFECWKNSKERGQEARFCSQYFVSSATMHMIHRMRKQLEKELTRYGFVPENISSCSMNAQDPGILQAVLVAGLYPMFGRFLPPKNGKRSFVETASGLKVSLHPHSLNFKLSFNKNDCCPLIVCDEITRGDGGMHIKNCTVVGPLPLLLHATEIAVGPTDNVRDEEDDDASDDVDEDDSDDGMDIDGSDVRPNEKIMSSPDNWVSVVVDRCLHFGSTAIDVAHVYCLRERLSAAILFKVTLPLRDLPPHLEASMHAITRVLLYDGLSGISLPAESLDSLTSMVNATEMNRSVSRRARRIDQGPSGFLKSLMNCERPQGTPSGHQKARPFAFKGKTLGREPSVHKFLQSTPFEGRSSGTNFPSGSTT